MKRMWLVPALALLLVMLAGCGKSAGQTEDTVDLNAFFDSLSKEYDWGNGYMEAIPDDLLDDYYPGLSDYTFQQKVIRAPAMSAVVNEVALVECESDTDAEAVQKLLQKRADDQAAGGAWYPESMDAWGEAEVIRHGSYVALIACAEHQSEISDKFNALFETQN